MKFGPAIKVASVLCAVLLVSVSRAWAQDVQGYLQSKANPTAEKLQLEREAKQKKIDGELESVLKRARDILRKATNPTDLDAAITELKRLQDASATHLTGSAPLDSGALQPSLRFLEHWQDYLSAQKNGSDDRARESLTAVLNLGAVHLIPRSEVLARLQKYWDRTRTPEQVEAIVAKAKSLEDVSGVIEELRNLERETKPTKNSDDLRWTLNALSTIENTYQEFKAGLPTRVDGLTFTSSDSIAAGLFPLKNQLLLLVLPRYLSLPPDISARQGEAVLAFLDRVADEARRRGDAMMLSRVRDAQTLLLTNVVHYGMDSGPTLFVAGQNQEAAGQFMLAVISYQSSLKSGSNAIPAEVIGERLSAIKAAHPDDYVRGMNEFLNPPVRP